MDAQAGIDIQTEKHKLSRLFKSQETCLIPEITSISTFTCRLTLLSLVFEFSYGSDRHSPWLAIDWQSYACISRAHAIPKSLRWTILMRCSPSTIWVAVSTR